MLKFATLVDNAGEPLADTRYRDPSKLAALGYNALVLYETTSLSGMEGPEVITSPELRRWVEHQFDLVTGTIERAKSAGLAVYIFYDVLSLPRDVVMRDEANLCCRGRPGTLCPGSEAALERSARALESQLRRWSTVDGVVVRIGDNDGARFPHLMGNDIYLPHCPRCSQLSRADRVGMVASRFYRCVVEQMERRMILRAWNVRPGGMHDTPDLARRIAESLPGNPEDDRLVLSFKFTETDFWRYQAWNQASLSVGGRPVIYELQCQREFEGKGGIVNWQPPLWLDGAPESRVEGQLGGLRQVRDRVNLAGLWGWVRGGGWGGPFLSRETWVDANVFAIPRIADHPTIGLEELAQQWVTDQLGVDDAAQIKAVSEVLFHSEEHIRKAFYIGPHAAGKKSPWHPNGDWIQDDLLDVQAAWRMIQRLPESRLDEVIREKVEASNLLSDDRTRIHRILNDENRKTIEPMVNSLIYGESLYEALRELLAGMVVYRRVQRHPESDLKPACRRHLLAAQSHWNHHTQRHATLPGVATAFRESGFWDLSQDIISKLG